METYKIKIDHIERRINQMKLNTNNDKNTKKKQIGEEEEEMKRGTVVQHFKECM